jgi:hypothetical protein
MEELTEEINLLVNSEIQEEQEGSKKRKRAPSQLEKDLNGEKMCNDCLIKKPFSEFYRKSVNKEQKRTAPLSYLCKDCYNKRKRIYNENNHYRLNYNTSREEVKNKLEEQNSECLICTSDIYIGEKDETSSRSITKSTAVLDHCHKTGQVRGLLCNNCNRGIGLLKDSPEICINAANYLKKYLEKHAKTTIKEN